MIKSKHINRMVLIAMLFALICSVLLIGLSKTASGSQTSEPQYASKIFGEEIISIEILADEATWQEMLDNAINEQFIMVDVIVNGTKFQNVGIRPKGNSSLSQVAMDETTDRYSFRLRFDEYVKGQTCFGLDSFVINNMHSDNSYMKEYVSYELMSEIGVNSPYFGYADIKLNGQPWGLYLAVEAYGDSYEQRVSGDVSGNLYNVKSMDMGGGGAEAMPGMPDGEFLARPDGENVAAEDFFEGRNGGGGMGRDNTGGSLAYIDDASSSYSAIFGNVVGSGSEKDYQKVISALKALSEGRDLAQYFDIDQILRYFAAHTIVVNLDSYSSSMAQNYYIYERDGIVTILPWDYNLAWGGFQSGNTSSVINFPIDTPVSGVEMSTRPLLEKLFANNDYLQRYHGYLQELLDKYFANGQFKAKILALDARIADYVNNDPTKFCTDTQYQTAVQALITLGELRAQSVQGQLNGTIPSTTAAQSANADQLVSDEGLRLSDLGLMGGMGERGMPDDNQRERDMRGGFFPGMEGDMDRQTMMQAMQIIQESSGELTVAAREQLLALGLTDEQIVEISNRNTGGAPPGGVRAGNADGQSSSTNANAINSQYLLFIGLLLAALACATLFAAKLKKSY